MSFITPTIAASAVYLLASCLLVAQPSEDEKVQAFYKDYLEEVFRQQPVTATFLGDHRFDAKLDEISPEARAGWRKLAQRTLEELPKRVSYGRLSRDGQIDFEIWQNDLRSQLWSEENMRPFEKDPRTYGNYLSESVYQLVSRSTAPKEVNIASAIARMQAMPSIVEEARRSLTHPVRPMLETAIRQNQGAINFYEADLFNYTGEVSVQDPLKIAAAKVAADLKEYQKLLEGTMRERAVEEWRVGRQKFNEKFDLEIGAGVSAEQNFADAQAEFTRVQNELYTVSRQLWSRYFTGKTLPLDDTAGRRETIAKIVNAVSQEHGTAEQLLAKIRDTVAGLKAFIGKRDYLRMPEPDQCAIIEMPEFKRGNAIAYLDSAPPLDTKAVSFYAVSPPPADWTPEQKRSFLEEYNDHMLQILTIHEAYPGHYVQLEYANRVPSLIRRVLGSGSTNEGWAVYSEVTMLNEGYGEGDLRLRLMQLKFYLRAVANSILDYRMHCTAMSDDEAMKFLNEEAFQSEGEARLKVIRAKQSAVQLSTYFVGRMALYRLRQTIERELGDQFDLGRYHEAVISIGSVPPKYLPELVRRRLSEPR
ncbi:MAG: DUF885 domain-containing protein [Verrucomicrobiota bacterium]